MAKPPARDEWLHAQSKLMEAERAAGIEEALKDLNQRNACIASAEENDNDYRRIIFAVFDLELRRQIIHFTRECHRLCRVTNEHEVIENQARVRSGGERIRRGALWAAIFSGVMAVWLGNHFWGNTGALIGAVVSALVGFDSIRRADRRAVADVEEAKKEIRDVGALLCELGTEGTFSATEEATGEPAR